MAALTPSPPLERHLSAWADRVQAIGLYLTASSLFLAPTGVSVGLAVVWLGFLMSLAVGVRLPMSAGVWFAVAFVVYVVGSAALADYPGSDLASRLAAGAAWAQLSVFVPLAYALCGDQRLLLRLLALALTGLLLGMLWRLDWGLLWSDRAVFFTSRPGFGFPAIVFALISGVVLVGLVTFRTRWWKAATYASFGWRLSAWLIAMAFVAQAFLLTLSRGAWLALAGTVVVAVWMDQRDRRVSSPIRKRGQNLVGNHSGPLASSASATIPPWLQWVFGLLLLGLMTLNSGPIIDRLGEEQDALRAMLSGEIDYSVQSSLSQRWHAQRFGMAAWRERPWFGWGPGSSHALIVAGGGPSLRTDDGGILDHLHNTYLELLVQFGLFGLALWAGMFVSLFASVHRARNMGRLDADVARFLMLSIVYLSLWDLIDFHATHQAWRGLWALLAGSALSVGLFATGSGRADGPRASETVCVSR